MTPYVNTICFAHIKDRLETGRFWGLHSPITPFQVDGCLDLISDYITGITDKEQLVNALRSICWQIVIGKKSGTNDQESGGHVLSKQTVEKLFDAMNTAVKSSGVSVKPREIFDYDDHRTIKSFFDDLQGFYHGSFAKKFFINRSPKMYSYRAERWEEDLLDGVLAIDEPLLGNLAKLSDKTIDSKLALEHPRRLWEFTSPLKDMARNIRKGDIIIARQGKSKVLGFGVVKGDYYYDKGVGGFKHRREVQWTKKSIAPIDDNYGHLLGSGSRKLRRVNLKPLYRMLAYRLNIASCKKALQ